MASYESWGELYNRLYPDKHVSELTSDELDFYYDCIRHNYKQMKNNAARGQYIADVILSASILEDQEEMQAYHLRFVVRLLLWAFGTKKISVAKNYM